MFRNEFEKILYYKDINFSQIACKLNAINTEYPNRGLFMELNLLILNYIIWKRKGPNIYNNLKRKT